MCNGICAVCADFWGICPMNINQMAETPRELNSQERFSLFQSFLFHLLFFFFFFPIVILFYIIRTPLTQRILESVGYEGIFRDMFSEVKYQNKLTPSQADFCDWQEMGSFFVQGTLLQVRGNVAMQVEWKVPPAVQLFQNSLLIKYRIFAPARYIY